MKKVFITGITLLTLYSCSNEGNSDSTESNVTEKSDSLTEVEDLKIVEMVSVASFIPEGMVVLAEAEGYLNEDDLLDKILVLKMNTEEIGEYAETPRNVMILIKDAEMGWELKGNNPNIVYCQGCGGVFGDPFAGISIKDKTFTIEHYGGSADRWSRSIRFEYSEGMDNWVLMEDLGTSFSAIEPNSDTTYTYYNKKDYGMSLFDTYIIE